MILSLLLLLTSRPTEADFGREVRPVLAERCFACHGPDAEAREADLRLDLPEGLFGDRGGYRVVDRDRPERSELLSRLLAEDPDQRMPPPNAPQALTEQERARLIAWVKGGGQWEPHWAFVAPERPALPGVGDETWVRNPVDAFVLARLEAEGLTPAPEANRRTLIRRLYLDLLGLPPDPEEIEAFLADERPDTYERLVERLLGSPHHGERLALAWLDLARYADTNGYSIDGGRHVWAWRDQVIAALNANQPFDRFTVEQLAGDLIPAATREQRLASGFNRNHMTTREGGTIPEEYLVAYAADRVRTTTQTWMGLTLDCARCHDHKYDPVSQREYYEFFAFFDSITEQGRDGLGGRNPEPSIPLFDADQQAALAELRFARRQVSSALVGPSPELDSAQAVWEREELKRLAAWTAPLLSPWRVAGPFIETSDEDAWKQRLGPENGSQTIEWRNATELTDGSLHALPGQHAATYLRRTVTTTAATNLELSLGYDDLLRLWVNGAIVHEEGVTLGAGAAADQRRVTVELRTGENELQLEIVNFIDPGGFYFAVVGAGPSSDLIKVLKLPRSARSHRQTRELRSRFRSTLTKFELQFGKLLELDAQIHAIESWPRTTAMVMEERPLRRDTRVLDRGRYDRPLESVERDTPACLPPLPKDAPRDRLGLARWLVHPSHPLTARVAVNSWWQLLFGRGLVPTPEDFGTSGEPPSHPKLLDWLAVELIEGGWDQRAMLRTIVTSATYRQDSRTSAAQLTRDPENVLLARGARFRLQAEVIRDLALAASGLLVPKIGGPGARPYQPDGLWREVSLAPDNATEQEYVQDHGEQLWRRSLYTFWKRTVPPPVMAVFDAPNREVCVSRRGRTLTPLQALALLNETGFVEAARALAQRVLLEADASDAQRLERAFLLVLGRPPSPAESALLVGTVARERSAFAADPQAAADLLSVGEAPRDTDLDPAEHGAWTLVASTLLNLEEAITRR